jgi:hypothetical protein
VAGQPAGERAGVDQRPDGRRHAEAEQQARDRGDDADAGGLRQYQAAHLPRVGADAAQQCQLVRALRHRHRDRDMHDERAHDERHPAGDQHDLPYQVEVVVPVAEPVGGVADIQRAGHHGYAGHRRGPGQRRARPPGVVVAAGMVPTTSILSSDASRTT